MYLIAGLGNPGKQYEATRHNMGFDTIDCLVEKHNIPQGGVKLMPCMEKASSAVKKPF